jgi:hypothetical protein
VISAIFERFVEQTPLTVMVRALMERIFAPELLDQLFEETAEQQYQRTLLFSTVVGLMSLVVCGMYPSVSAAYKGFEKVVGVSKVALYDKINGLEPNLSQALVRYSSEQLGAIHQAFPAATTVLLANYEVRILDGNHIAGTEHRLKVLREEVAGALPCFLVKMVMPKSGRYCRRCWNRFKPNKSGLATAISARVIFSTKLINVKPISSFENTSS